MAALGVVLAGCSTSPARQPSDELSTEAIRDLIVGVEWRFESRDGKPVRQVLRQPALLVYGETSLALLGGCNTSSGRYGLEGNWVYPYGITRTPMACDGVPRNDFPVGPVQNHRVYVDRNRLTIKCDGSVETFVGEYTATVGASPIVGWWRLVGSTSSAVTADISFHFERRRALVVQVACEDGSWAEGEGTFGLDAEGTLQLRYVLNYDWPCAHDMIAKLNRLPLTASVSGTTLTIRGPGVLLRLIRRPQ